MEVPEKDKKLIQRSGHGAVAATVNSDCVEVILFGGLNKDGSLIADTVAVRLGEFFSVLHIESMLYQRYKIRDSKCDPLQENCPFV